MPFKSLEQAYYLYNYKRKVFIQMAGAYGVYPLWHDYKKLRDDGIEPVDAKRMVHRYTIKKWQRILKRGTKLNTYDKRAINEIMSDGKERTLDEVKDEIFKRSKRVRATSSEIGHYLSTNYNSKTVYRVHPLAVEGDRRKVKIKIYYR